MLPTQIVCAACHRASEGHDPFGYCVALRRTRQAEPMTPTGYEALRRMEGYAALRKMVRSFERTAR
jgi:hypothetical protein